MTILITSHIVLIISILTTIGTLAGAGEKVLPSKAAAVCGVVATIAIDALRILDIFASGKGEPPQTPPPAVPAQLTTGHDKIYPIAEDMQPDIPVYHSAPKGKGLMFAPAFAALVLGCSAPQTHKDIELGAYASEQALCDKEATSLDAGKACLAGVRAEYKVFWPDDAGVDGGKR